MPSLGERLKYAWSAFTRADSLPPRDIGPGSFYHPDRPRMSRGSEQSILNGIITRLSIDCSSVLIQHVRLDDNGSCEEVIDDGLNQVLNVQANIDQTAREFIRSAIAMMLDKGHVVLVPTKTLNDPLRTSSYEIKEMRAGQIVEWYPKHVKIDLYDDDTGKHREIILPKRVVAIIYNPFYSVMNEPNSMFQRLKRKLVILDAIDEQSGSGKLDLIIQLPYSLKGEGRRLQAENRRKEIESQLNNSKFGIAYIDSTEHVTQLNRAVENNLMKQIEYLTTIVYGQLGLTQEIIDGTANEQTMLNYNNRTTEPIVSAFVDSMKVAFLTKTARSRKESIIFYRDPFKLMPAAQLAEFADKFTRNEILSPNELRRIIGYKAVDDPRADELRNRNLNQEKQGPDAPVAPDDSAISGE